MTQTLNHCRFLAPRSLLAAALLLLARPAPAQRVDSRWSALPPPAWLLAPSTAEHSHPAASAADSSRIGATYWLEGAGVGTVAGAVAGGLIAQNGGLPGAILIGIAGFGVGALIGGLIPKK